MAKKDRRDYMSASNIRVALCNTCKHYNGDATCKAFPSGIPYKILEGADHFIPIKEQANDIVYKRK